MAILACWTDMRALPENIETRCSAFSFGSPTSILPIGTSIPQSQEITAEATWAVP